jgi:galactofuranosylgalactofuranosylrhamnosyl-N-acetylglucosaminyl-diphospho-decaprenol beta-1,5/1,6-galactofuranosyltransferase
LRQLIDKHSDKFSIIEQANFGGSGGFTRGIIEALANPALTHVVLIDDDAEVTPECLLRMCNLFSVSREDFAVAGQMLDAMHRTKLCEAGARINPFSWQLETLRAELDVGAPGALAMLLGIEGFHYGGWWCFGLPLRFVSEVGLPLPYFIRGDDVEYGIRLHHSGKYTVSMPGIAAWHPPFKQSVADRKLYYSTRNFLITCCLHFDIHPRTFVSALARMFLERLLTYRYYDAGIIILAVVDFIRGPATLTQDPKVIDQKLQAFTRQASPVCIPRETVLIDLNPVVPPRTTLGYIARLLRALFRNALSADTSDCANRRKATELTWLQIWKHDHVAVDMYGIYDLVPLSRSRRQFHSLALAGWHAFASLHRKVGLLTVTWREAHERLKSEPFWIDYLKLSKNGSEREVRPNSLQS